MKTLRRALLSLVLSFALAACGTSLTDPLTPDSGSLTPDSGSLTPDSGSLTPDSGSLTPDSGS